MSWIEVFCFLFFLKGELYESKVILWIRVFYAKIQQNINDRGVSLHAVGQKCSRKVKEKLSFWNINQIFSYFNLVGFSLNNKD